MTAASSTRTQATAGHAVAQGDHAEVSGGRLTATLDAPARPPTMPACQPMESPSTAS